jgi:hypothetical protein
MVSNPSSHLVNSADLVADQFHCSANGAALWPQFYRFLLMTIPSDVAEKVGAEIVECACIIELPELKGREKLGEHKLFVLVEKEGL